MTATTLYIATRLDGIKDLFCGIEILSALITSVLTFTSIMCYCEWKSHSKEYRDPIDETAWPFLKKLAIISVSIGIATCIIDTLTPSTKEFAVIYAVPKMIDGGTIDNLGEFGKNMTKFAVDWSRDLVGTTATNTINIVK